SPECCMDKRHRTQLRRRKSRGSPVATPRSALRRQARFIYFSGCTVKLRSTDALALGLLHQNLLNWAPWCRCDFRPIAQSQKQLRVAVQSQDVAESGPEFRHLDRRVQERRRYAIGIGTQEDLR